MRRKLDSGLITTYATFRHRRVDVLTNDLLAERLSQPYLQVESDKYQYTKYQFEGEYC